MLTVDPTERGFALRAEQWLPAVPERVFEFFADAFQLQSITPAWLHFRVLTPAPIEMRAGTLIDYRLRLHGIPIRWQSEISVWEPPVLFVDRQVRGPYQLWQHEHHFTAVDGGTRMVDHVDYRVFGGALVNRLLVEGDLRTIFEFRRQTLKSIWQQQSARGK